MFAYALHLSEAKKSESLMIGDNLEVNIIGARNFWIDKVYLNLSATKSREESTYEINSLLELKGIL
ncbi:MAG: HAD hydrolase-like protein [Bacteroidales bacterium]|nr:HAD hydrolase-like protein [Bacteroidales bacterium]